MQKTKPTTKFTPEETVTLQRAARRVWETIAHDILQASAEYGITSIPRAEVIEVVLDASRLEDELKMAKAPKALIEKISWRTCDHKSLVKAVTPAFGFGRYS